MYYEHIGRYGRYLSNGYRRYCKRWKHRANRVNGRRYTYLYTVGDELAAEQISINQSKGWAL